VPTDDATRPTAPELPPGVGVAAVGQHLIAVHDHYRRELAQVRDVLRQVAAGVAQVGAVRGQLATMTLRANAWTLGGLCQGQCRILAQHHSVESDAIFPHLRASHSGLGDVLDRLDAEHHAIHRLLDGIDTALVALAHDPTDLAPITAAVDLLTDTLLSHFAYEEHELVGPLARFGFYQGQD